ncbi:MAG TPA: Reeler domain-containing protein [Myxococcota bacterium]|nr:Reeler domain-containing protein [Myxococcota bacterium]
MALALAPALAALASSSGPQPGESGVPAGGGFPAEPLCTSCHTGFPLNSDGHGVLKLSGVPARYVPGQRYTLTIELHHPDAERTRWGFQLTAISAKAFTGAGEFVITDSPNTELIHGVSANRSYVSHSYYGTGVGEAGGRQWSFDWIAPSAATGKVEFFGAGNAANADGSKEGDRIYSPSPKPLAVTAPGKPGKKGAK